MKAMRPGGALSGGGAPIRILPTYQAATGSSSRRAAAPAAPSRSRQRQRDAASRASPLYSITRSLSRDADAAETHGEARRLAGRQHQRGAGLREPRAQPVDADFVEHGDRRHVERQLQRAAHA